jgi:hypothetical protein
MRVELGDDAPYSMKGSGSISFKIPSIHFLEFKDVLFVTSLKRNILSFTYQRVSIYSFI